MFAGTGDSTDEVLWTGGHAFTILSAQEVNVNGKTEKMIRMRNPWGSHEWFGRYKDGSPELAALAKVLGDDYKDEGGKFWMPWT